MLIFKTKHKWLTIGILFLIALHAFNTIFLSLIISNVLEAAGARSMETFIRYFIIGVVGFLFFMVIGIILAKLKAKAINYQNTQIKETMINYIVNTSKFGDDDKKNLSLLTNDLKQLETKGIHGEYNVISMIFTFVFALMTAFFAFDFWMSLAFLLGSIAAALLSQFFKNKIKVDTQNWQVANAKYTNKIKEYLLGIETVKTYQVEEYVIDESVKQANNMETNLEKMSANVDSTNQILYMAVMLLTFLIPFAVGIIRVIDFGLGVGAFTGAVYLSNSLRSPALQSGQIINEYATTKPIRDSYEHARTTLTSSKSSSDITNFESIKINDALLKFDDQVIFNNANFEVLKGDKILITGPSGIGKSTLLRVIQQKITLDSGTYLYNDYETELNLNNLFSLISQKPLVFDDTILYNITLGQDFDNDEVLKAVSLSQLDDVVSEKGLNYLVGEGGKNLSVGELQRIEIARALIRKRPIILADEITSALDNNKASLIREMLLKSDVTLVEVAHNVSQVDKQMYTKVWDL